MRQIDDESEASQMITSAPANTKLGTFAALWLLLALAGFSTTARAEVGYVHEVSGTASIQRPVGESMAAKAGDMFESGTIFRTGVDGKLTLKFVDGQIVVLSPDTIFRVGPYRFDANNIMQSGSTVALTKGEMRFVTGVIGAQHREGIRITAGSSVISILAPGGADFTVVVNPDPQEVGLAAVALGEIGVRTPYGIIDKVTASQFVPWQAGRTLSSPVPIAAAPANMQAAMMSLFATVVPANTPVNVATAAVAAALVASPEAPAAPTQARVSASEASLASMVAALPPTGRILASGMNGFPSTSTPILPPVTPGGGGACTGSVC
jgi:hypothetical protein